MSALRNKGADEKTVRRQSENGPGFRLPPLTGGPMPAGKNGIAPAPDEASIFLPLAKMKLHGDVLSSCRGTGPPAALLAEIERLDEGFVRLFPSGFSSKAPEFGECPRLRGAKSRLYEAVVNVAAQEPSSLPLFVREIGRLDGRLTRLLISGYPVQPEIGAGQYSLSEGRSDLYSSLAEVRICDIPSLAKMRVRLRKKRSHRQTAYQGTVGYERSVNCTDAGRDVNMIPVKGTVYERRAYATYIAVIEPAWHRTVKVAALLVAMAGAAALALSQFLCGRNLP